MKSKIKHIFTQIIAGIFLLLLIVAIYYYSYLTGGSLTTVTSCSGSYIKGELSIDQLKKSCSNLSKESLIQNVNEHFDNYNGKNAFTSRDKMLNEIESFYR